MTLSIAGRLLPRRAFLRGLASAALFGGVASLHRVSAAVRALTGQDEWWLGFWSDEPSARFIGRRCIGAVCQNRDAVALAESIAANVPEVAARSARVRRAALGARVRDDFGAGRTVWVDGWLLSDTEVRLYALTALSE